MTTELFVREARNSVQGARDAYAKAISQRSASQREVNELLQRKHAWTAADLERFTELYRSDHANEQAEATAQNKLASAEKTAEEAAAQLSKSILARYHEEQIWSDKIRRMSTWGTWGLMGVNVLLFLVFQIAVEPWRRKRLVKGFEEKVLEALEKEGPGYNQPSERRATNGDATGGSTVADTVNAVGQDAGSNTLIPEPSMEVSTMEEGNEMIIQEMPLEAGLHTLRPTTTTFGRIKEKAQDMFSDRPISLRQIDLTTVALEGAAAGIFITGLTVALFRFR